MEHSVRRKSTMEVHFGVLYEVPQFLVSVCIIINYDFSDQVGTESAI